MRPRVLVYAVVLAGLCVGLAVSLALRTPLKVDVVRDRAALARIVAGGRIENVYRLQVMNATEVAQVYRIGAEGLPGLELASEPSVAVGPAQSRWVAVRLQVPYASAAPGSHAIHFNIAAATGDAQVSEKSVFVMPR
jgi:polyferredoxin